MRILKYILYWFITLVGSGYYFLIESPDLYDWVGFLLSHFIFIVLLLCIYDTLSPYETEDINFK